MLKLFPGYAGKHPKVKMVNPQCYRRLADPSDKPTSGYRVSGDCAIDLGLSFLGGKVPRYEGRENVE